MRMVKFPARNLNHHANNCGHSNKFAHEDHGSYANLAIALSAG